MTRNPLKFNLNQIQAIFNRALPLHTYQQLIHFVAVEKVLAPMPGKYVIHKFYKNGSVAIATSEPDINDWLKLHGKAPMKAADKTFNKSGSVKVQAAQTGYSKSFSQDALVDSKTLQDEIMHRLNNGETITSIAKKLNCSGANICYHKRKYNERMAKQLEVDS